METREAARRWAQAWERAWNEHDPNLLAPVYADGCVFRSAPFRAPAVPSEYVAWAFSDEESAQARFAEPVVDGDRAAVEWWAFVREDGRDITLAGTSLLRFREDGQCVEQRDEWAAADGRVERRPGPNEP